MDIKRIVLLLLFIIIFMPFTIYAADKGNPPVAHWRFNEGGGGTAYDESANNNDGTLNAGTGETDDYKNKKRENFSSRFLQLCSLTGFKLPPTIKNIAHKKLYVKNNFNLFTSGIRLDRLIFTCISPSGGPGGNRTRINHLVGDSFIHLSYRACHWKKIYHIFFELSTMIDDFLVPSVYAADKGNPPVAHWRFDECGGPTAYDESTNNNDGTLNAGTLGTNTAVGQMPAPLEILRQFRIVKCDTRKNFLTGPAPLDANKVSYLMGWTRQGKLGGALECDPIRDFVSNGASGTDDYVDLYRGIKADEPFLAVRSSSLHTGVEMWSFYRRGIGQWQAQSIQLSVSFVFTS